MDPAKMKVVDLRSELGALGLDTKGNKPALVERLKKALEAKTGKVLADTSILDTTTEDVDDVATPRRPGPAARTTRRSSSSRLAATPSKPPREDPPESIEEDKEDDVEMIEPVKQPQPVPAPVPAPVPEPAPKPVERTPEKQKPADDDVYEVDDKSQSPIHIKEDVDEVELVENQENKDKDKDSTPKPKEEKMDQDAEENDEDEDAEGKDDKKHDEKRDRELTEEEEWEILNERLKIKEQERLEREKKQAEEDAKLLEEVSKDPIKLQRLKRKQEKKARWSNFYKSVEVTNEVLAPPVEPEPTKGKKEIIEPKVAEPEINDERVTLSWYDSDLHQYLELPELNGVVPLSEGVFSHAWAGCRATHGAEEGRVCYEVRVGTVVTTTETTEGAKDALAAGLRMGWSTDDMNLHLGEGELSWGYETTGRAVHNSEFKEYGKSLVEKDVVGVYLDLESSPCKISYTVNGVEQGVAYEFDKSVLGGKPLFPHVLTKNMCYKVNFGYDRYNMLTKTKIVRKRIEVPLEQVLEEKKALEEEIRRQKEEAAKRARERRERDKKEREERQRKKREERERIAREKKEKELQEKKDKEAEEGKNTDADANADEEKDKDKEKEKEKTDGEEAEAMDQSADSGNQDEPKENGDKTEIQPVPEVKEEPMETEQVDEAKVDTTEQPEVKGETVDDDVVEVTEDQVLKGLVLDKRIKFVIRHTAEEELEGAEACLLPGYVLLAAAQTVPGPRPPADRTLAEVILMVGMPGAGKTYWARQHSAAHPERRYNILSTGALFDRMKVDCKPFRTSYEGRWDAMVSKCAKCVQKLLEIAKGRRRNYILDQRRKLKEFDGYRRVAVVVVTDDETYRERHKRREETDGKEVPDGAVVDMKANFALPEKCSWLDEVTYAELGEEEAKQVIEAMHKEARAAGVLRDKDKRERSASRDAPPAKRPRDERRHAPDRRARDAPRDRDRWGGGGGGSRWGPAARGGGGGGGGGGRWGRERGPGGGAGGPPGRFDRWGGGPPAGRGGNDFGRDRDGFRGGRGGGGGRGERGGHGGHGGPPRGPPPLVPPGPAPDRFRNDRNARPPHQQDKRPSGGPPQGGGTGSWQRGGGGSGGRGGAQARNAQPPARNQPASKEVQNTNQNQNQNQNQQNPQGWNQWAGGWGGWGNWNQNQGWGNYWGNWGNQTPANANPAQNQNQVANKGQNQAQNQAQAQNNQQWPANYTAQQWYQWQQWQQQQQGWQGYQQQQGTQQGNMPDAQAWAQYYQNYSGANAAAGNTTQGGGDKK